MDYGWIKALHIVSVIVWMAALLCLPQVFALHAQAEPGATSLFRAAERRLLRGVANPAAALTVVFGTWLVTLSPGFLAQGWLHAKLTLVFVLVVIHAVLWRSAWSFAHDVNHRSPVFYRILGDIPALLMIAIVVFVVVKPF